MWMSLGRAFGRSIHPDWNDPGIVPSTCPLTNVRTFNLLRAIRHHTDAHLFSKSGRIDVQLSVGYDHHDVCICAVNFAATCGEDHAYRFCEYRLTYIFHVSILLWVSETSEFGITNLPAHPHGLGLPTAKCGKL